jgi:hypothetical protein
LSRVTSPPEGSMDEQPVFSPDGTLLPFARGSRGGQRPKHLSCSGRRW